MFKTQQYTIMGDFNIAILKYDSNYDFLTFLDNMYENLLFPYIISPTRVTPRSRTIIDNIFSNIIEEDIISGNITTTISDHYIQFVLFENQINTKTNIKKANFARNYNS